MWRLMPSREGGDMCSRPATSFPDLMRWSVVASVFSSTAMLVASFVRGARGWLGVPAVLAQPFKVAAAVRTAVLAEQQLRPKEGYQFGVRRAAKRARNRGRNW